MGDALVGFLFSGRSSKRMFEVAQKRAQERYRNKQTVSKLKALGYVTEKKVSGQPSFFITQKGKQALHDVYTQIHKQRELRTHWDGLWRVVSYDFPEQARSLRNSLRYILEKAQFLQIQKSVWLSPFDSRDLEAVIARHPIAQKHIVCMVVHNITHENRYKRHFQLR